MITHKTETIRTFKTKADFEKWFARHASIMSRTGFSQKEIETLRKGEVLTIQDREDFVHSTVSSSQVVNLGDVE